MITFSDLQTLEVIQVKTGEKLGFVYDLEIDPLNGRVVALVLMDRKNGGMFRKGEDILIPWEKIATIGDDVILIEA